VATASAHHTWQPSLPCRISVALSGGGHRATAWALGTLYGMLAMRDAERAKGVDGVPIEFTAIASVSGGSIANGVFADELHKLGVDIDDVALADFRRITWPLLQAVARTGLIPAKGRTRRYLLGLLTLLTFVVAAIVATVVAVFTTSRGTPGFAWLLPLWLGVGALIGIALAVALRHVLAFFAVLVVAAAGALTWGFLGDTRGDAAWIAVVGLLAGTALLLLLLIEGAARRGAVFEHALDATFFGGRRLADVHSPQTRHVFCATELQSGHQCFLAPEILTEWNAGEGEPNGVRLATAVRASAALPLAFPPVELDLDRLGVRLARPWRPKGEPPVPVHNLVLTDGGVYDNMADEWEYGYPERAERSDLLSPKAAANFLVVGNAGKDIGWERFGRTGLVWRELRGIKRDVDVVYDVSTSQRRRTLLRLFREAEQAGVGLVGVIAHMPTSPLDVCAAFTADPERGPRAEEARIALNNMHEHWTTLADRNGNVATTLSAISVDTTVDLILQAAALVTVSCYVVHGLGVAAPPTRAEIRAWVEGG
jgi:hypothetical protein